MANYNFHQTAAFIWSVSDLLRGAFKQSQYGRVILLFTLLRRLECMLEPTKDFVVAEFDRIKHINLSKDMQEVLLLRATQTKVLPNGLSFFNTSPMNLSKMEQTNIKSNLEKYVQLFSKDAREIFEHLRFDEIVGILQNANLLYKVVKTFATIDFSTKTISNHEMGLVFDELIRRFAESSNETAGEHFTPRDIVRLSTSLVFMENNEALVKEDIIRTIYDPTAGTGGFLSAGIAYLYELNPKTVVQAFGQELNPESYAICKADMLIKGQDISHIKLGNTLSNDQLPARQFDYIISNPPFGMDWRNIQNEVKDEHEKMGFYGRFGAGLPRLSDSSLLFLMHLISKMHNEKNIDDQVTQVSRIGIILNGSPLFTGGAGSGESEIRRYILETDLLEAIVALPTDMLYNTGIATYIWVLSNKKDPVRKGKVQLINATNLNSKLRNSLGSKKHYLGEDEICAITKSFSDFLEIDTLTENGKPLTAKICDTHEFGYRRLTIERPLRLSAQITDEAVESLRFAPKPFNAVMQAVYEQFGSNWTERTYGSLIEVEAEVYTLIKTNFPELKEKQIKEVLNNKLWISQKKLVNNAKELQIMFGNNVGGKYQQSNDFNQFELTLKNVFKTTGITFDTRQKKQFIDAITWKNQEAEPVIKKVLTQEAQPLYGAFDYKGKVVEFQSDIDLRDNEDVTLDLELTTPELIKNYFLNEIYPYINDAWLNTERRDNKDGECGVVGYRINFRSYFQRSYPRDKLLQGNIIRFKEIVRLNDAGLYVLEPFTGKITEFSGLSEQRKMLNPTRFDFHHEMLLPEFYNIFLQQEEGKDWLESNFMPTLRLSKNVSMSTWLNARFSLPPIGIQSKLIDFWEECEAVLTRVSLLKNSVFSDFQYAQEQLLPYLSVTSRYEQEFSSMLPTPLAILWELAESKFNERERCEAFIKFFEYLGIYLVSFVFGQNKPSKRIFYKGKKLPSLTMAFSYNWLSDYKKLIDPNSGILSLICRNEVISFLHKATKLRNDIAHRGLPSAVTITEAKEAVQRLNKSMQLELREFFEVTTLIKPVQAKFDGNGFLNEVEVLKGLGLNPSKTAQFKTSEPMISGELYLAHNDLTVNENVAVTKIFPLMVISETLPESEVMGFYFYSDVLDDKLRFVCPYPNVETYKFFDQKLITDNLDN